MTEPISTAADGAFAIQFDRQCLAGEFALRDVRQDASCVDVNGVTARGLDGGNARVVDAFGEVGGLSQAIGEIGLIQPFVQTDRHRVEVAACQSAIGGEALAQDQFVLDILEELLVVHAQQAADVDNGVLLGGHGHAVGQANISRAISFNGFVLIAGFALLDEVSSSRRSAPRR